MRNARKTHHCRPTTFHSLAGALCLAIIFTLTTLTHAASWSNIEPFKSRRVDVEQSLGKPIEDNLGTDGTLQFRVAGGTATVAFVTHHFVETKKLAPELEGTVLQIILQHDAATDTPESLKLVGNGKFAREARDNVTVFRNTRDGMFYTFVNNHLKTSRYAPTVAQQAQAQKDKSD